MEQKAKGAGKRAPGEARPVTEKQRLQYITIRLQELSAERKALTEERQALVAKKKEARASGGSPE